MDLLVRDVAQRPAVAAAGEWLRRHDSDVLAWQRAVAAIPAPTGAESARAAFVAERLAEVGLAGVRRDAAGNVLATLGAGSGVGVVLAAHLDTVFAADVEHRVLEADGRLVGPGVTDNSRGLAALLALACALRAAGMAPPRPLTFVATTGEEGAGDLEGARFLFEDPAFRPEAFIAVDGAGAEKVVHRALGSRRLRAVFRGPGGHSWAAFGVANPAHAVGLATARIAALPLPAGERSAASVVRIGGGSGLNSIPGEAWLDLDLRSESGSALDALHAGARRALEAALEAANRQRAPGTAPLALEIVPLGTRPSGATSPSHPLVRIALAATRAIGRAAELGSASTDASVAIARGVPAIALGAGGRGGDPHLASEWYDNAGGPEGLYRLLLVALAAAEWAAQAAPER